MKYLAKTFTMPDVRVGSILEYYYTTDLAENFVFDSHWILNHELYTMHAKFTLNPYDGDNPPMYLRTVWHELPVGAPQPKQGPDHVIRLEVTDVPSFQTEDYIPPENELKSRVDFIYSEDRFEDVPEKYWAKFGKKRNGSLESFLGRPKSLQEAVSSIISPSDSPEVKLQKIYARVQQIRNTSFEAEKTEQEQKRNKEKTPTNAQDVWKKQYGYGGELTWLFLGLVRAAGFEAYGVWVADRQNYFFFPQTMDGGRLDQNVVLVKVNGKDMYFDPGSAFIPFGMLPWFETGVKGLKIDKDGGSWIETTLPASGASTINRKADLTLSDTGDLEGKLTVTYTGLEAANRRTEERLTDDADRKKYVEDEVKGSIPAACDVELTNSPDWKSSDPPLVAEFKIKIPGWVSAAGHRALMPVGLFSAPEKHLFDHADRVHPIYFEFPFERVDEVNVNLPLGWRIATVPAPQKIDAKALVYDLEAQNNKGTLHLNRVLNVDLLLLPKENYPNLRKIFQIVRSTDEEQVMLQPGAATASN